MTTTSEVLPLDQLRALAQAYGLLELYVFGSTARGDRRPDSDVDLLYVTGPNTPPGLAFYALVDELEQLLGRQVDLVPKEHLHWLVRDRVIAEAEIIYAAR